MGGVDQYGHVVESRDFRREIGHGRDVFGGVETGGIGRVLDGECIASALGDRRESIDVVSIVARAGGVDGQPLGVDTVAEGPVDEVEDVADVPRCDTQATGPIDPRRKVDARDRLGVDTLVDTRLGESEVSGECFVVFPIQFGFDAVPQSRRSGELLWSRRNYYQIGHELSIDPLRILVSSQSLGPPEWERRVTSLQGLDYCSVPQKGQYVGLTDITSRSSPQVPQTPSWEHRPER